MSKRTARNCEGEKALPIMDAIRLAVKRDSRSQAKIARAAGLEPGRLSEYLHGRRVPTLETLERLCQVLNLRIHICPVSTNLQR